MEFLISALTDTGIEKNVNQDSYSVRVFNHGQEHGVFAVLCDGMGGYECGEIASASVVDAFCKWADEKLPTLFESNPSQENIRTEWFAIVEEYNQKLREYGIKHSFKLGTTLTALLITSKEYSIINIGDTRLYRIKDDVSVLTKDHTFVAREIERGRMTEEEAEKDPRRCMLLQCIGVMDVIRPDFFSGETESDVVYMLCSDGFRHEISSDEILERFNPSAMTSEEEMNKNLSELVELNKERKETDNISVIAIRTRS